MSEINNNIINLQGAQGSTGTIGTQGERGKVGLQGAQGAQGSVGLQGTRGCDGIQGARGSAGMIGIQGEAGRPGAQGNTGIQGQTGPQGAQGPQGLTGSRGIMGYVGKPGEVGIQGLQGAKGHIWVDGVSLDGYNTHLFTLENNRLKSVDGSLLTLGNGAKISLWLDENCYNYLVSNECRITVDDNVYATENGEEKLIVSERTAPIHYTNSKLLTEIIDSDNDLNTIVELVYYNGSWYYAGGLIGLNSSDRVINNYVGGKDIAIDSEFNEEDNVMTNNINISLQDDLKSTTKLGFLEAGETLLAGSSLTDILTKILVKEVGGSAHVPTANITINPTATSYEVGTALGSISLTGQYTDGYYTSANTEIYSEDLFNTNNGQNDGKVEANCVKQSCEYYLNNEIIGYGDSYNYTDNNIVRNNQTYSFKCKFNYSNSQVNTIKTNLGNEENINIESGSTNFSNTIDINFYHTTTVGVLNNVYWNESTNSLVDNQGNIYNPSTELNNIMLRENGGVLLKSTTQNENNEYSIPSLSSQYIVVPQGVTFFIHASADPQKNNLISQYRKYSVINDKGISYDIYIYSNNGSAAMGVKGLKYNSINNVINAE